MTFRLLAGAWKRATADTGGGPLAVCGLALGQRSYGA